MKRTTKFDLVNSKTQLLKQLARKVLFGRKQREKKGGIKKWKLMYLDQYKAKQRKVPLKRIRKTVEHSQLSSVLLIKKGSLIKRCSPFNSFFIHILQFINYWQMQSRRGWSEIEDDRLMKIIKKYGTKNWTLISDKLSVGTTFQRTGKQCRERWHNHLNPNINHDEWSKEEDETLFEAHRRLGSKWKDISKLFQGRTDNSIKNHFYSSVRKSLRTISKMLGEKNTTITMKSIKPFVLSKIVENTELTNLIVQLGRSKSKERNSLNIQEGVLQRISSELYRISSQYQYKNNQNPELTKNVAQNRSSEELNSLSSQSPNLPEAVPLKNCTQKLEFKPEELMKQYFEEFDSHHHQRSDFIETHHDSKDKHELQSKDIFNFPQMTLSQELKAQAAKYANAANILERQLQVDESCIYQQCESNFFMSPSCGQKKQFPFLPLVGKNSRTSHPSPSCGSRQEQKHSLTVPKPGLFLEEPLEINFDPREYLSDELDKEDKE